MTVSFKSKTDTEGITVTAEEKRLLSRHIVALHDWDKIPGKAKIVATYLLSLRDTGSASETPTSLTLPHEAAASLPEAIAAEINLPEVAPLSVTLSFRGLVEEPNSQIQMDWRDRSVRQVRPMRTGTVLTWGNMSGRLTKPLFDLVNAVDLFNASQGRDAEVRIGSWGPVQKALVENLGSSVSADRYLSSLTIHQAGALALDVRQTPNGPDFDPVLMSRSKASSLEDNAPVSEAADDDPEGAARDQEADALLPPDLQAKFVNSHFYRSGAAREAYVLAPNTFLVLSPELKIALDVVKQKKGAAGEERRAFIKNPRSAIAEALASAGLATPSVGVFVETRQYSERVLGLGIWDPPKLPWITKRSGQWLPESFPFQIGDRSLTVTPAELETFEQDLARATAEGLPTVSLQGSAFPVAEAEAAVRDFRPPALDATPPSDEANAEQTDDAPPDDNVLVIKTNVDGVEHEIGHRPRPVRIEVDFPRDRMSATAPKSHQRDGFKWLVDAWAKGWPGVLLADDMGLGKTFQALAFLAWTRKNQEASGRGPAPTKGPFLIVAPTALLKNWAAEAGKHLAQGALGDCVEAFGPGLPRLKRQKTAGWTPEDALDVALLRDADWILTTYETLADYHRTFARVSYSVALFDEMQKIKAPGTINTHAAKAMNADFVLGLTGTPIENRIEDLWCIMDRIVPGYLGDLRSFSAQYGEESFDALKSLKSKLDEPQRGAPKVMLRRMKENTIDGLPVKSIMKYPSPMPRSQAEAYDKAVAEARSGLRDQGSMLKAIHALRGISLHPEGGEGVNAFDEASVLNWIGQSARLEQAVAILRRIRERAEKAIVFIEDRSVQTVFAAASTLLFGLKSTPAVINGDVPGAKRQAIVDRFQMSPGGFDILVLSPKAAGIGLTITAANHVVHLSRWWNPAVEDQCNDRVYRIGQERPVTIHIPLAIHPTFIDNSFDKTLDDLLEGKRSLSRNMLAPPVQEGDVGALFGAAVGK
ncbi:DEAD/DEAH box helicase [Taklimakanibacter lacteus]|uniref:DEAD/DEAH box helicase n=1 Tax=Taklimakanibacter lacteus TaxID=2268456 RepID=UPI000E662EFE